MKTTWTKAEIKEKLETDDKWVTRGIAAIFEKQTYSEQQSDSTNENNGVGFTGVDAKILSSFAKFYNRKGYLSPKQLVYGRKKIKKYAGQLAKIANGKI